MRLNEPARVEARATRKVRRRILPFVFILFIIAALDRNNIGFAALTMNAQLAIDSRQFGLIAAMFFPGTSCLRSPAICCCTGSARAHGLRES